MWPGLTTGSVNQTRVNAVGPMLPCLSTIADVNPEARNSPTHVSRTLLNPHGPPSAPFVLCRAVFQATIRTHGRPFGIFPFKNPAGPNRRILYRLYFNRRDSRYRGGDRRSREASGLAGCRAGKQSSPGRNGDWSRRRVYLSPPEYLLPSVRRCLRFDFRGRGDASRVQDIGFGVRT